MVTDAAENPAALFGSDEWHEKILLEYDAVINQDNNQDGLKLREQQRLQAPKLREMNATSSYLVRLPPEIR